ncbi:MAG: hypothetical protein AAFY81_05475 [Pseudomonadota bacterium]
MVVLGGLAAALVIQFGAGALGGSQEGAQTAPQDPPTPPTDQPQVLGEGVVSLADRHEFCQTLSRDGRTLTIGIEHGQWQSIEEYKWDGARWVGPKPIVGKPDYNAHDPYLSADEQRLYFITAVRGDADLAYLPRQADGSWGEAVFLEEPINSGSDDYYTSITKDGAVFLSSSRGGQGFDLYEAPLEGGLQEGGQVTRLPDGINTRAYEGDPFVDPDRRYLIFASSRRGGLGRGDLYLSVAEEDGSWSDPIPFDERVNTKGHELCPHVSLDGSAFMFTSNQDIRWVSSAMIDEMIAAHKASAGD